MSWKFLLILSINAIYIFFYFYADKELQQIFNFKKRQEYGLNKFLIIHF